MHPGQRIAYRILANTSILYDHPRKKWVYIERLLTKKCSKDECNFMKKYRECDWIRRLHSKGCYFDLQNIYSYRISGSIKEGKYKHHALSFLKFSRNVCVHVKGVSMQLDYDLFSSTT